MSFDGAGLILVRPGLTASGAHDGVAYFSRDGRTWQYAGTIAAAGGWTPDVVKGSDYGFVVIGHTRGQYVAYTSTGTGARWLPTGPLGSTARGPNLTPAVGPGGNVIAVGKTNATRTNQQGLLIKADTAGNLGPVSLSSIPGGLIPEETVQSVAVAGQRADRRRQPRHHRAGRVRYRGNRHRLRPGPGQPAVRRAPSSVRLTARHASGRYGRKIASRLLCWPAWTPP